MESEDIFTFDQVNNTIRLTDAGRNMLEELQEWERKNSKLIEKSL